MENQQKGDIMFHKLCFSLVLLTISLIVGCGISSKVTDEDGDGIQGI